MYYYIATYGCQMNYSDSERIAATLEKKKYKPTSDIKKADLIIVNMCSVRQKPVDKVYGLIHKLKELKKKNPNLETMLTGCILKRDKIKFSRHFDYVGSLTKAKPSSGFIPITRGCNNFCSYCVVPYTRGREKYRSQKIILQEIKCLIKKGIKKITLLGQNVNSYPDFVKLLKKITALNYDFKITFLTNHPKDFSDELIKEIAQNPKIIKYIHLPIQSGDNVILKKMNRKYTRQDYLKLINKIKKTIPNVEITTDVIVGFPGETQKQFQNTVDVFKKNKFSNAYISKYSPRHGTTAFKLKDDVPLKEKKRREQTLRSLIKI